MTLRKHITGERIKALKMIFLALSISGLFKVVAFSREALIAAHFGLSSVTDAYFALQQMPLTVATYLYGAFSLAFVPAYLRARKETGTLAWLPGLLFWGTLFGALLTATMLLGQGPLLALLHIQSAPDVRSTVLLLSVCFAPIVAIGLWADICNALGHNIWATAMTGFPFLVMAMLLTGLSLTGRLTGISLPLSLTVGFLFTGCYAFVRVIASQSLPQFTIASLAIWRDESFRHFLHQLGASSIENLGYAANQLLILFFIAQNGVGAISANTCAMRIGSLVFTLLGMPLGQLMNGRICTARDEDRRATFQRWLAIASVFMLTCAALLIVFRYPVIRLVYMHGKFQAESLALVAGLLPAWVIYFVITSVNGILARYLFLLSRGTAYFRQQLIAYAAANLLRLVVIGHLDTQWIIWCSVIAEGCSLLLNVRLCHLASPQTGTYGSIPQLEVA